jgi:hypothetical protein
MNAVGQPDRAPALASWRAFTFRRSVLSLAGALAVPMLLSGCSTGTHSTNQSTCELINNEFYYPTIPPGGEHVTVSEARRLLPVLRSSEAPLRNAASQLARGISTKDAALLLQTYNQLQGECDRLGWEQAT